MGIIYKITNKVNNKHYIGITQNRSVAQRWNEHLRSDSAIGKAIELYGVHSFTFEVLEQHEYISEEKLRELETKYIEQYNSIENGYNQIKSKRRNSKRVHTEDLNETQIKGFQALQTKQYLGTNNYENLPLWERLLHNDLNLIGTIIRYSFFTNLNSKYYKSLQSSFRVRESKYFYIKTFSYEYYTDSIDLLYKLFIGDDIYNPVKIEEFNNEYVIQYTIGSHSGRLYVQKALYMKDECRFAEKLTSTHMLTER